MNHTTGYISMLALVDRLRLRAAFAEEEPSEKREPSPRLLQKTDEMPGEFTPSQLTVILNVFQNGHKGLRKRNRIFLKRRYRNAALSPQRTVDGFVTSPR